MKKFYAVIGNPPYQEEFTDDGNKSYASPIYHKFMDSVEPVADRVELITPARFLFDAGSTPKSWNRKKLEDPHFKVMKYEGDASAVFPDTDIKGGVAVTYRDRSQDFGSIAVFSPYDEMNSVRHKVFANDPDSMESIAVSRTAYRLTDALHHDYPEAANQLSKGHAFDMSTNIFDRLPQVFHATKPDDGCEYALILGRENENRVTKWIRRNYINDVVNFGSYKLFMSSANGAGRFGEALADAVIGNPHEGATETFISLGNFTTQVEAENVAKYVRCKFTRAMLGIMKSTQHLTPKTWRFVPLQDFTSASDIDWDKPVSDIDRQLYAKYGLDDKEITFIESHVKEMN